MRDFLADAVRLIRELARECLTPEGRVLLGYTLVVVTHQVLMGEAWFTRLCATFLPRADDWMIRKDFLDILFYGAVVLVLIRVVQRENPLRGWGLQWPQKKWVLFTGAIFAVQLVVIPFVCRISAMRDYYPMYKPAREPGALFWQFQGLAFLSMVSWEFVNHGYLLFGLKKRFGLGAVVVGAVPFAILHFGKPSLEIYWSIADGMALALLAYASGSIWPSVWLHGVGAFVLDVVMVYLMPRP